MSSAESYKNEKIEDMDIVVYEGISDREPFQVFISITRGSTVKIATTKEEFKEFVNLIRTVAKDKDIKFEESVLALKSKTAFNRFSDIDIV